MYMPATAAVLYEEELVLADLEDLGFSSILDYSDAILDSRPANASVAIEDWMAVGHYSAEAKLHHTVSDRH